MCKTSRNKRRIPVQAKEDFVDNFHDDFEPLEVNIAIVDDEDYDYPNFRHNSENGQDEIEDTGNSEYSDIFTNIYEYNFEKEYDSIEKRYGLSTEKCIAWMLKKQRLLDQNINESDHLNMGTPLQVQIDESNSAQNSNDNIEKMVNTSQQSPNNCNCNSCDWKFQQILNDTYSYLNYIAETTNDPVVKSNISWFNQNILRHGEIKCIYAQENFANQEQNHQIQRDKRQAHDFEEEITVQSGSGMQ